jgi:predicted membrane-bound spermidine synthase
MQFLLLTGLLALLGQVVLLRELNVAFFGVELIYILAIGVWMCGTALGALAGPGAGLRHGVALRWLTLFCGAALPLDVAFIRASARCSGASQGIPVFPVQLAGLLLAVIPAAFLLGLLFQWAARAHVQTGRTLAEAYGIESVGGLAGGLAATLLLRWGVQNFALAAGCAVVAAVGAIARDDERAPATSVALRSAGAMLLCAAVMALWRSGPADRAMTRWNHPALAVTRDTPYARVTVARAEGQLSVYENDALALETQGTAAEEFAHLAAISIRIRGGSCCSAAASRAWPSRFSSTGPRVDDVELDRVMFEAVVPFLPGRIRESLQAPALRLTFADPRRFLQTSSRYDLILVAMGEPNSGQANRFYTREFYEACAARLTATGVLAYRLQSAENIWPPLLAGRMSSLLRAPALVFRDVVVLPGTTNIVLVSRSTLLRDPGALGARLVERGIRTRLVSPRFIAYLYTNDRRAEIERTLARGGALVNTDLRPICYQCAAVLWLSKFFPVLSTWDLAAIAGAVTPARRASAWRWPCSCRRPRLSWPGAVPRGGGSRSSWRRGLPAWS